MPRTLLQGRQTRGGCRPRHFQHHQLQTHAVSSSSGPYSAVRLLQYDEAAYVHAQRKAHSNLFLANAIFYNLAARKRPRPFCTTVACSVFVCSTYPQLTLQLATSREQRTNALRGGGRRRR